MNTTLKAVNISWQIINNDERKDIENSLLHTKFPLNALSDIVSARNKNRVVDIRVLYKGCCQPLSSSLDFTGEFIDPQILSLGLYSNTTVEKLNLSYSAISDDGVEAISSSLVNNITLQELDLSHNRISSRGMNCLLKSVKKISTLKYIDLSGNHSSPWAVYCAVIRHCCMNSLTVCGDQGMERHVKEITDSLEVNKILKSLRLRSIGRVGHWLITEVLDKIKISISVDLRSKLYNKRTDSCSENVADGIDIGGDNFPNIANMGIGNLAGLIIVQSLDLSCNNISDDEVLTIIDALKCNNVLK